MYRKNVLVNPIIDLKIINLKVTVLGEIRAPGNYQLIKDKTSLVPNCWGRRVVSPTGQMKRPLIS